LRPLFRELRFEYLVISVGVDVLKPGNYVVEGSLSDFEGNEIEKIYAQMYLDAGLQTVPLMFKGKTIYTHGISGVFRLTDMLLYDEFGVIKDAKDCYTTGNYNYEAFKPLISLTGEYTDRGEDTNGNSMFDNLVISLGVDLAISGNVTAKARLLDRSGNEILWASNTTWIEANQLTTKNNSLNKSAGSSLKALQLRFDGHEIYKHGTNGPYLLRDLNIYHAGDPALPDYANEAYSTPAYEYQWFEHNHPPGKPIDPNGSVEGFVNTKYEYAVLSEDPDADNLKYTFDWGDAASETDWVDSGTSTGASHKWTNTGIYKVRAKATDSKGLDSEWSNTINVSIVNRQPIPPEKPIGVITGYALAPYSYATSSTDPDEDMVSCTFDWGDKTTSDSGLVKSGTKVEASHTWTRAGTYQVKAKAMDSIGDESLYSSSLTVIVNPNSPPTVPGKPSGSATCIAGSPYSYSALATDSDKDQVKYIFDWADGTKTETNLANSGTKSSAVHAWNMAGTYQVKVTAMDSKGAASRSSSSLTVTVNPNRSPTAPSKPSGSTKGYAGVAYSYTTSARDPDADQVKYSFDWGDGTKTDTKLVDSGTGYSAAHAWNAAGTYRVKVKAMDSKEAASQYSGYLSVKIIPNGVPSKPSVPSGAVTGKIKKTYIYRTSATDPDGDKLKYKFDWGDGKTSLTSFVNSGKSASSSHAWSKAGTYQVKVVAIDSKGASSISWSSSLAVKIT
jgi:hypothetical protein